jgi:hypothetical protein
MISDLWKKEAQRVVTWSSKMNKFQERLNLRLLELEEMQEMLMQEPEAVDCLKVYPIEMLEAHFD